MKIRSLEELEKYSSDFNLISFDLFDTLIFREHLSLDAIKESAARYFIGLLARVGAPRSFDAMEAVEVRTQFTTMLKGSIRNATEEPSIEDVYKAMATSRGLDSDTATIIAEKTSAYEFELDSVSLSLMPSAIDSLETLVEDGKTLFLISDMYYTKTQILEILERFSIRDYFSDVFVSSTSRKTKQKGSLYRHLLNSLNTSADAILHIGDNRRSDVKMAEKSGLKAVYFKSGTHYSAEGLRPDPNNSALDKFGNISAFFVLQVLQQAWSLGLNKVFFLSRDASALCSLSNRLTDRAEFLEPLLENVELRELAISRSTATFLELNNGELSFQEVLFRLCWILGGKFKFDRLSELFSDAGCGALPILDFEPVKDFEVGKNVQKEAKYLSTNHSLLAEQIVKSARQLGVITYEYLLQEGVVGSGDVGFVDVGYTGTAARNIAHYLTKEADDEVSRNTHIHLFLMATGALLEDNFESSISHVSPGYLMTDFTELPTILRTNYCWFECFAKDYSRGALLGYQKQDEGYRAVFESYRDATGPLESWCESYTPSETDILRLLSRPYGDVLLRDYLNEMAYPKVETIEYMDTLSHGCGLLDDHERSILNRDLSLLAFLPKGLRQLIRQDYWLAGSIRASGFGNWANVWVGSSINVVRNAKAMYRSAKKSLRKTAKRYSGGA